MCVEGKMLGESENENFDKNVLLVKYLPMLTSSPHHFIVRKCVRDKVPNEKVTICKHVRFTVSVAVNF